MSRERQGAPPARAGRNETLEPWLKGGRPAKRQIGRPSRANEDHGYFKAAADKTLGKSKEAIAEMLGDGKLREEAKAQQRKDDEGRSELGGLKALGDLDRLT